AGPPSSPSPPASPTASTSDPYLGFPSAQPPGRMCADSTDGTVTRHAGPHGCTPIPTIQPGGGDDDRPPAGPVHRHAGAPLRRRSVPPLRELTRVENVESQTT